VNVAVCDIGVKNRISADANHNMTFYERFSYPKYLILLSRPADLNYVSARNASSPLHNTTNSMLQNLSSFTDEFRNTTRHLAIFKAVALR
jgi:hypothetical protein